ncbi:MAG: type I-E CRISPR-associated protein Cas7/Cse4/CasC [Armatimonadetes bacterium]|nr:type I-E CRISPR-associated protein Cas7/Cse4/CasC [Armatimonadota bacterium]
MFVELHLIQNFAPSCLNRDDTNSPKDCEFGGFRRARISSQCIKRSIRHHPAFAEAVASGIGTRTKLLADELAKRLAAAGKPEDQVKTVCLAVVEALVGKLQGEKTAVLVYLGDDEIQRIADIITGAWDSLAVQVAEQGDAGAKSTPKALANAAKEIAKEFKSGTQAADIALFGRMVAENANMNVDAACQVAHAISTHKVAMEMDFYTAVDDLPQPEEDTGAAMMGTVEFNSSCFYRYSLINLDKLVDNLGGDGDLARQTVEAFLRASVVAIPTGKQNSMAAQNPPSFVFATVREGGAPWSLANAFEKPVRASERGGGLVAQSIEALASYWSRLTAMYGDTSLVAKALCTTEDASLNGLSDVKLASVDDVISAVRTAIEAGA